MELGIDPCAGLRENAILVANTPVDPVGLEIGSSFAKVGCVDAWGVTKEIIGPVPPNAAMLGGAFACTTGWVGIDAVCTAIEEFMTGSKGERTLLVPVQLMKGRWFMPAKDLTSGPAMRGVYLPPA